MDFVIAIWLIILVDAVGRHLKFLSMDELDHRQTWRLTWQVRSSRGPAALANQQEVRDGSLILDEPPLMPGGVGLRHFAASRPPCPGQNSAAVSPGCFRISVLDAVDSQRFALRLGAVLAILTLAVTADVRSPACGASTGRSGDPQHPLELRSHVL